LGIVIVILTECKKTLAASLYVANIEYKYWGIHVPPR